MNEGSGPDTRFPRADVFALLARWILGGVLLYMGQSKALHPVEFLKIVHEYGILENPTLLNFVAATLPWFEMFCGLLLIFGVAVRGAACTSLLLLLPFSAAILHRALALQAAKAIPLCAIRFDCGCGAGEVAVCRKLAENALLAALALALVFIPGRRWCLRPPRHDP